MPSNLMFKCSDPTLSTTYRRLYLPLPIVRYRHLEVVRRRRIVERSPPFWMACEQGALDATIKLTRLADFFQFRATRSGALFSNYYTVNDPDFDIDQLLQDASAAEVDEPDPVGADADQEWVDEHIAPSTESLTPLSSAAPSVSGSRAPSPSPSALSNAAPVAREVPPTVVGKKRGKKARARARRAEKAARRGETWAAANERGRKRRGAKRVLAAELESASVSWNDMSVTSTGYGGKREEGESRLYALEDLIGPDAKVPGMKLLDWDGKTPTGITAPDERVFAVLAGQPDDARWSEVHRNLADEIDKCRQGVKFPSADSDHRRGQFSVQANGVSHGGGQTAPANLKHTPAMTAVLTHLLGLTSMLRIAVFASSVFACWAPLLFAYYAEHMSLLFKNDPSLVRNFARSIWACVTINFGPQTVTYKHRDFGNLPFGWCAITALGRFDADRGGHLVLWECKLVIRFPPGATVLIPSAIIHHSNTRIRRHERRFSVTQYTAGALFRWVDHGFQLDSKFYMALSAEEKARVAQANARRWKDGVHLWSKIADLRRAATDFVSPS